MDPDPPCRLIYVIGMPSGGTTAAAGTLANNGVWVEGMSPAFENDTAHRLVGVSHGIREQLFDRPPEATTEDIRAARMEVISYKSRAVLSGYDEALLKWPGASVWRGEMFAALGDLIEPLLVYRHPRECAASIRSKFPFVENPLRVAEDGQNEILRLHQTYGWPMWEFGRHADTTVLEEVLGRPLRYDYFDRQRVGH